MNQKPKFSMVVAYVDDVAAAKQFYVNVLGMTVEREAPNFVQFDHFAIASDGSMDGKRQLEVYWVVDDVEAALKSVRGSAEICMDLRALPFGQVFGVRDPTGQPRYFMELSKNRPSRPM